MTTSAVIGLGYGDEGKGVTTEYLCSRDPRHTIVARFSGGPQAGHKVIKGDVEHIFSSFGAGTLSECPTYWSQHCTFDPVAFCNEYSLLREKGFYPRIFIHPDCPVTTIFDVFVNRNSDEVKHGTTGTGFFRTKKRHFIDGLHYTFGELFNRSFEYNFEKLKEIKAYYDIHEDLNTQIFFNAMINLSLIAKAITVSDQIPQYKNLVFEGSQGLMLDEYIGHMPHCTPSDLTPRTILSMNRPLDEIFLVTRAYQTRHGNGPMTNEEYPVKPINNEKETNVSHRWQGEFRTTVLDLDQLMHAKYAGIDSVVPGTKVNLVVTCLDQLTEYKVTDYKTLLTFKHPEEFVKFLGNGLNINGDLYMNDSPHSTTIRKLT